MRISVAAPDFAALTDGITGNIAKAATRAMGRAAAGLKDELRAQVTGAGMSRRLANTWRDRTFPRGRNSLNPAGYVWSNAPQIVESYASGATLRPMGGKKYLWIPTRHVPRQGRGGRNRMSPTDVEIAFNQDLIIRQGKGRTFLAFVNAVSARRGSAVRQATRRRQAQGRQPKLVLMFVLVPSVKKPKLFDLPSAADDAANRFVNYLSEELATV